MASEFSNNNVLELIETGAQAGVWGQTNNRNLTFLDTAVDGTEDYILGAGTSETIEISQGVSVGRNKVLRFSGGGATATTKTINFRPSNAKKVYFAVNDSIHTLTFSQGAGGSYTVAPGFAAVVDCNGGGDTAIVRGTLANLQVFRLKVANDIVMEGSSTFTGNLTIDPGGLSVKGASSFTGDVGMNGKLTVVGDVTFATGASFTSSAITFTKPVTASAGMYLNVGGDAPYDMYYRAPSGAMARVPIGAEGTYLRVTSGVPAWRNLDQSLFAGMPVTGISNLQLLSNQGGVLAGSGFYYNPTFGYCGVLHVNPGFQLHVLCNGGGKIAIDGDATAGKGLRLATGALMRWDIALQNGEAGSNTGADLSFVPATDAGTPGNPTMRIYRSSGNVVMGSVASDLGASVNVRGKTPRQMAVLVRAAADAQPGDAVFMIQKADGTALFQVNHDGSMYYRQAIQYP